jgi:hypothetical protein
MSDDQCCRSRRPETEMTVPHVDDDDVSATVTVRITPSIARRALTMAGAAPLWNGNDERRPMLSTTTGNDSRVDDNDVSATVTVVYSPSIARLSTDDGWSRTRMERQR